MNSDDHAPRILGIAFLLQAVTSLVGRIHQAHALSVVAGSVVTKRSKEYTQRFWATRRSHHG